MSKLTAFKAALNKRALDTTDLPGYGRDEEPEKVDGGDIEPHTPEEWSAQLGIPVTKYDGKAPLALGDPDETAWTADVELVDMGHESSYGLAGAPIHMGKTAYCVMVVLKHSGTPVLYIDPHQWEEGGERQLIENTISNKLEQGKRIMDVAYGE
jgi:hypothetical protein